jgi:hypothetical protein
MKKTSQNRNKQKKEEIMKALIFALILLSFGMVYALTGQGDSNSATFDTVDPAIAVTVPLGNATWYIGYNYQINWNATDTNFPAEPIKIEYSSDGGSNYSVVDASAENTGDFAYTAAVPASANARVRLVATDTFGNNALSLNPGVFNVAYCPPPQVTVNSVSQRTDGTKTVDIYYDLADVNNDACAISIFVSENNGSTYAIVPESLNLSGDVGAGIMPGAGKHVVWVAGNEARTFDGNTFRVRVQANDGTNPPQP